MVYPGYVQTNISKSALICGGRTLGKTDDNIANGMTSQECANQICKAISLDYQEFVCSSSVSHHIFVFLFPLFAALEAKLGALNFKS
jgi:hypothetical protein